MLFSRRQLLFAGAALALLRVLVGWHFYREGIAKVRAADFSTHEFLLSACGPLAPWYHAAADDADGHWRLCLQPQPPSDSPRAFQWQIDPAVTFAIWDDFLAQAAEHYSFGDEVLARALERRVAELATRPESDAERQRAADQLERLRGQMADAEKVLALSRAKLEDFLAAHGPAILVWAHGAQRLDPPPGTTAGARADQQVESLRGQSAIVRRDRAAEAATWFAEVETIWDNLEDSINELAIDDQRARGRISIERPYRPAHSIQAWLDRIVPWFDVVVGGLLVIGLFTPLAGSAAALLLAGVIASQPPWIAGAAPTMLHLIELAAALVIVTTRAGRFGGFDVFLDRRRPRPAR